MSADNLEEKLKVFAIAKAPEGARLLLFNIPPFGSNLDLVTGFRHEICDIIRRGDSQIKDIPLTASDITLVYKAELFLRGLSGGRVYEELSQKDLFGLLRTVQKVTDVYYNPKTEALNKAIKENEAKGKKLSRRFADLVALARNAPDDPRFVGMLEQEFYPDGVWDPEADDLIPEAEDVNVTSLLRARQQSDLHRKFAGVVKECLSPDSFFTVQSFLGMPRCFDEIERVLDSAPRNIRRTEAVISALTEMADGLRKIIKPERVVALRAENDNKINRLSL